MSTPITWEEPPAPATKGGRTSKGDERAAFAVELRKNPGKWALLATYDIKDSATSTAYLVRTGRAPAFEVGSYEAVSRKLDDGRFAVYVRYIRNSKKGTK